MRKLNVVVVSTFLVAGCMAPGAPGPHPAQEIGRTLGYLVVSPALILIGLLEGIATLPYFLDADLHGMNTAMKAAKSEVTLEKTYQYAYNRRLDTVPKSGNTGRVFRHLSAATKHFQKVLKGYGVKDYDRYIITAVRTADREGYTLYALVYRPARRVRVLDGNGRVRVLGPGDYRHYYSPFEHDASRAPLDAVIDWAAVPRTAIKTQKGQAILMTLAANAVIVNRRSDDFWATKKRWIEGDFRSITAERKRYLDRRMGKRG